MIRATAKMAILAAITSQLSGCFFFMFSLPSQQASGQQTKSPSFAEVRTMVESKASFRALARAGTEDLWVSGWAFGKPNQTDADEGAMLQCNAMRARDNVTAPCVLHPLVIAPVAKQ